LKGKYLHTKVAVVGPCESNVLTHCNYCWQPLWKKDILHYSCCWGLLWKQRTCTLQLLLGHLWKQGVYALQLLLGAPSMTF